MTSFKYYTTLEKCLQLVIAEDNMALAGTSTLLEQRLADLQALSNEPVGIVLQAMEAFSTLYQTPSKYLVSAQAEYDACSKLISEILRRSKNAGFINTSEQARNLFERKNALGR